MLGLGFRTLVDFTSAVLAAQYLVTCAAVVALEAQRQQPSRFWQGLSLVGVVGLLAVARQISGIEWAVALLVAACGLALRRLATARHFA